MTDWILANEPLVRAVSALSIFGLMAAWELLAERRRLRAHRGFRWVANLGLVVIDVLLVRLVLPAAAVGVAVLAEAGGWGLLNQVVLPDIVVIAVAIVLLDLVVYGQHVLFHAIPVLWRLHMVHHADLDFDTTTGLRFHPVEILLSMLLKMGAVAALGAPPVAVLLFEVLLNGTSLFNHGNVRLPVPLDRVVRWLVVTPDMHRVHHSVQVDESNTNFGFNLSLWDRLFGTYRAQPRAGHERMRIGVAHYQDRPRESLAWMLGLPFFGDPGGNPLGSRKRADQEASAGSDPAD